MPTGHLYVFFGQLCIEVFCPFFGSVSCFFVVLLSCVNCLYVLEIKPLSVTSVSSNILKESFPELLASVALKRPEDHVVDGCTVTQALLFHVGSMME